MTHETQAPRRHPNLDAWWAALPLPDKQQIFREQLETELARDITAREVELGLPAQRGPHPVVVAPNAWVGVLHGILAEREYFDPEAIRLSLAEDLPHGLRGIAEAIHLRKISARCLQVEPHGFSKAGDQRMHLRVVLDLAADVVRVLPFPLQSMVVVSPAVEEEKP